ncbi:extracellular solute-binding protein [Moraxella canis]|uniref:Extracellular solute-binding protein n=2 Tax=Moraxella canis TaxID=90239 RepID=A0ABZ0WZ59_9GAMM|nr:extracellular solute-binding protein [Moraxella canis]WQE04298.1 extracellular solute-binding protein [Moraxella canis]
MRLAFRVCQKPRIAWLGSWFLVFMVALYGCGYHDDHSSNHKTNQSVSQDTDTKSLNVQPDFLNTLDPAPLSQARRDSHLTDRLQTQTALAFNNSAQYAHLKHLPYANPHAPKGGTLSMAAIGMFNSLNSFIDQGVPAAGTFYLYDTLMAGSLDEAFVLYPQLADKVSFDPTDRSWIIYHIHPDARFWDGSAVTAYDVQATYQAILSKGLMSWRAFLSGIEAIEVLDTHQVKFYFTPSAPTDLGATVGLMPVFARDDIIQNFDKISLTPLMGSGPYRLDRVEPSRRIRYIKDPSYWGQDIMVNQGRFNFDAIEYVYFADEAIAFEGFKSGTYRFRIENDIKRWATFEPKAAHGILKAAIPNDNPVLMQGLVMNLRKPLFQDIRVRRALNLAFDFEWTNAQLLYGEYERLNSYFFGSEIQAKGQPDEMERQILSSLPLNDDEKSALIGVPKQPISTHDGINRSNLLKAKALLEQAGFSYRQGHLIDPSGKPVRIEILLADDQYEAIILPYITHLKRLGIQASLRRVDNASYIHRKRHYDFDMIIDRFMQGNAPGAEQAYLWGSASADEIGNQNTIGIKSAAIDQLIDRLTQADTRADIVRHARVLDRLLLAGEYMIPWYGKTTTDVLYYNNYHHPDRLPSSSIGLDYWWYE